jgi:hypothetical protein
MGKPGNSVESSRQQGPLEQEGLGVRVEVGEDVDSP